MMLKHFFFSLLAIFLFNISFSQYPSLIFKHISTEKGLSYRQVNTIAQDNTGFIWIGTSHGLNRYNGYSFKIYLNDSTDKYSISDNNIRCIFEDSKKRLWICTYNGLNLYDRDKDRFISFKYDDNDTNSLKNNKTEVIYEDHSGNLWVGHFDGISKLIFDEFSSKKTPKKISFQNIMPIKGGNETSINWIFSICEDNDGKYWLGSFRNCIYCYNPVDNQTIHYTVIKNQSYNNNFDNRNWIKKVFLDNDSTVWALLHANQGLARYDKATDSFIIYRLKDDDISDFNHMNTINSVVVDKTNTFWLATDKDLQIYNYKSRFNRSYLYSPRNKKGISQQQLNTVFFDKNNGLWIGTEGTGINYSDRSLMDFTLINASNYPDLETNDIIDLQCNFQDEIFLYFVNYNDIYLYYPQNDKLVKKPQLIKYFDNNKSEIVYAKIDNKFYCKNKKHTEGEFTIVPSGFKLQNNIKVTSNGDAWGMTREGLYFYDRIKETSSLIVEINSKIAEREIYVDNYDSVWILTQFGLKKLSGNNTLESYLENYNFMHINITSDAGGDFWLSGKGSLLHFNMNNKKTSKYGKNEGFNAVKIYSVEIDSFGNVWMTSDKGISMFDVKQKRFTNYSTEDGLPFCNYINASCKDSKGNIYFGSHDGVMVINPKNINLNSYELPLVFTSFKLFNKEVKIGDELKKGEFQLEKQISETKKITLKHNQNVFSIGYAALNYSNPNKNQYAYYLEGLEQEWNYVGKQLFASYSGLQPGSYTFRLKGTTNGIDWNEKEISLKIIILPPFWKTWLFRIFIMILTIILIFLFIRIRMRAIIKKKNVLEKLVKRRTAEVQEQANALREVNQFLEERQEEIIVQKEEIQNQANDLKILNSTKDKFFSIIAHDLKNPFHAINGVSELILNNFASLSDEKKIDFIQGINKSSVSASSLLENLLQWARIQINKIDSSPTNFDLYTLVLDTCNLLNVNASNKLISLANNVPKETYVFGDRYIYDTAIRNLVNNAIKFSIQNTKITISSTIKENVIIISVADQGIGMEKDVIDKLFRIDQQISRPGTTGEQGSGLGLIICHDLIIKNNGEIWAESIPGKGSTFFIKMPYINNHKAEEISKSPDIPHIEQIITESDSVDLLSKILQDKEEEVFTSDKNKPIVLLVDDNPEILETIRAYMEDNFTIFEAPNGKKGYKTAIKEIPDLIVCDWMMPEMDGIVFCEMIKKDERTSHIPCIMLTAKNTSEDETQGLITGADDYITKPFNTNNLVIKIKNILNSRKKLREKLSRESDLSIFYESSSEPDKNFMKKLDDIIHKNITNQNLNYKLIAKEIGMSRTQLYKKINALTNLSVHGYIKKIRLHTATKMLLDENKAVSEVAYQLCFSNPFYFTRCFTELYGKSPTQFIADQKL